MSKTLLPPEVAAAIGKDLTQELLTFADLAEDVLLIAYCHYVTKRLTAGEAVLSSTAWRGTEDCATRVMTRAKTLANDARKHLTNLVLQAHTMGFDARASNRSNTADALKALLSCVINTEPSRIRPPHTPLDCIDQIWATTDMMLQNAASAHVRKILARDVQIEFPVDDLFTSLQSASLNDGWMTAQDLIIRGKIKHAVIFTKWLLALQPAARSTAARRAQISVLAAFSHLDDPTLHNPVLHKLWSPKL